MPRSELKTPQNAVARSITRVADGIDDLKRHRIPGAAPKIEAALREIRAIAREYTKRAVGEVARSGLADKLARHGTWQAALDLAIDAYRDLAGDDIRNRPFVPKTELRERYRVLNKHAGFPGPALSFSEIFALLHREEFLEKRGTHWRAEYRLAPHVSRLRSKE